MDETILVIDAIALPAGSGRGITQTLEPIDGLAKPRRTINAELIDISAAAFRKYKSTITFADSRPPALDGIWIGQTVTVDCISELWFLTASGSPAKPVVPGSSRIEGAFTFYNPRLTMMITALRGNGDEWAATAGAEIDLEEV